MEDAAYRNGVKRCNGAQSSHFCLCFPAPTTLRAQSPVDAETAPPPVLHHAPRTATTIDNLGVRLFETWQ